MTTYNGGRRTIATRGGRTGGQTGRGGGRTGEQTGIVGGRTDDQGGRGNRANGGVDEVPNFSTVIPQQLQVLLPTIVAQVGDHVSNQGNIGSQNDNVTNDSIHEDDRMTEGRKTAVGMIWEDFKALMKGEYYPSNKMLVPHLVTPDTKRIERYICGLALQIRRMVVATEPRTIQSAILKAGVLTDEAVRNGSLKRSEEARQDPNIVTSTFSLNNQYDTILFDFGVDYSFVPLPLCLC
nr:reverse transcriptase domain-containing protein [Tanacetum cinerariifolium]